MTETVYFNNIGKLRQNKEAIEKKLGIKLNIKGRQVTIEAGPVEEYETNLILEAFDFGFDLKDALSLTSESMMFRKLPIKQFTKRKDLTEVRARMIGTEGKTKRALENISGCAIVIHDNMVGVIGPAEAIEEATTAIGNLIRGSKQSNIYRFLERMNTQRRTKGDLGLKHEKKEADEEDNEEEPEENDDEDLS